MSAKRERLAAQAAPVLGEALADLLLAEDAEGEQDPEVRRFLIREYNHLLSHVAGDGALLMRHQLNDPDQLRAFLRNSMEVPAQTLAKALPRYLKKWLKAEPSEQSEDRLGWASEGRLLLEQMMQGGGD